MERPQQKPQDNRVKNQPKQVVSTPKQEVKIEKKTEIKQEVKQEKTVEEQVKKDIEAKAEEETKEEKKKTEKKRDIPKKTEAVVNGKDLGISKKHSMAICDFIRGKNPDDMITQLEKVVKLKMPIKMKGEIPHRKGKMMSGRYPVNASKVFIKLLKSLSANSQVNGLDNPIIALAKADDASRPFKRGGSMRFKRTNVLLIAKSKIEKENKKEKK